MKTRKAVFCFWWEFGNGEGFPMYDLCTEEMEHGTVGKETLMMYGVEVPYTPSLEEWKKNPVKTYVQNY